MPKPTLQSQAVSVGLGLAVGLSLLAVLLYGALSVLNYVFDDGLVVGSRRWITLTVIVGAAVAAFVAGSAVGNRHHNGHWPF
jgi:hypothetical protein